MNAIDIHPEELFDKLDAGTLSGAEGERLRAHLEVCEVCRFELDVRGDFRAEVEKAESPPVHGDQGRLPVEQNRVPAVARRRRTRHAFVWIGAAAAFLMATGALASVLAGKTPWQVLQSSASESAGDRPTPSPQRGKKSSARTAATNDAPAPVPASAAPSASTSQPSEASATTERGRASAPSGTKPGRSGHVESTANAAGLFKAANRARGAGDLTQAVKLYRRLQREFPESSEAALSQLTLATLLLHTNDSRAALAGFDAYLARASRPLEAEALVGRALSLRALGQREAEVSAWQAILRRYPGSSYARRAADRLAALGRP